VADVDKVPADRPWSALIAYSRAKRRGPLIEVGGTTATSQQGSVLFPGDAYGQARYALEVMVRAIEQLGGSATDVVRTRAFLVDVDDWEAVGRAHGEVFAGIEPASTFVESPRLLLPGLLVELEATAYLMDARRPGARLGETAQASGA